jgi:hypothetical protein
VDAGGRRTISPARIFSFTGIFVKRTRGQIFHLWTKPFLPTYIDASITVFREGRLESDMPSAERTLAYVIRTFVRRGQQIHLLPPTICFERGLALQIAEEDAAQAWGVAVFEIDLAVAARGAIGPVKVYGEVPVEFRCTEHSKVIAAAPALD